MGDRGNVVRFPNFSDFQSVGNGYGAHPFLYSRVIGEFFSQGKEAEA